MDIKCSYSNCKNKIKADDAYKPLKPFPEWNAHNKYIFCSEKCFNNECIDFAHFSCSFCDKNLLFSSEKPIYHPYDSNDHWFCNKQCEEAYPKVTCYICKRERYYENYNKFGTLTTYKLYFVDGDECDVEKDICHLCYEERQKKFICNICEEYVPICDGLVVKDKKNMCNKCAKNYYDN